MRHPMENLHPSLQMKLEPPLALTTDLSFVYLTSDVSAVNVIIMQTAVTQTRASVSARITPSAMIAQVAKKVTMETQPREIRTTASYVRVCLEHSAFELVQKSSVRIAPRDIKVGVGTM